MLNTPANLVDTVIVGAGPYGLSLAAQLQEKGVPFRIFGRAMQTWAENMPAGMHLQSAADVSNLASAGQPYSLQHFCAETGSSPAQSDTPVPLETFVAYGEAFARRFVPHLEPEHIKSIDRSEAFFRVTTASGERFFARHVVVATGLSNLQHIPAEFRHLPVSRVTHPSQHRDYSGFANRDVTVLGSGASALNAAALLHESGARVTLLARARKLRVDAASANTRSTSEHDQQRPGLRARIARSSPDMYHFVPSALRSLASRKSEQPAGDRALHGRLEGFATLLGCRIHAAEAADGSCGRLRLTLTDSHGQARQHLTSHLIAATGYRVDKDRLTLLSQSLREQIRVSHDGAPKLNGRFESSVPGLHFVGPLAASSFGPALGSLAGVRFASERVAATLQGNLERERRRAERSMAVGVLGRRERAL